MSTYEESLVAARFAALAPAPLAGDWADVVGRVGARKGRRWLGHPGTFRQRRRRLFVVLAVVTFVAVVSASALAVRAFVLDKGFFGLPAVGATPSTPESGVLEMYYWVHDVRGRTRNWVYADGRLIRRGVTRDNGTPLPGFREQRLTLEGVKLLRSEIVSAGGFGHAQPPPGSESLHNANPPTIQIRRGDRLVPLSVGEQSEASRGAAYRPGVVAPGERVEAAEDQGGVRALQVRGLRRGGRGRTAGPQTPTDESSSHRGSSTGVSPEGAPRQGLGCERARARLLRSDDQRSPLARQVSRRRGARKEGASELQIRCPNPEPTGLDHLRAVPPSRRDHLLEVRMRAVEFF